jgi:glycosyltransferase involved in cell wall biosynthesis
VSEPSHAGADSQRRLRVLISAYAFGPSDESEASAGWTFGLAAARHHDVWVITRRRYREGIEATLAADPELAAHLHVQYLELSERMLRFKRKPRDVYWYYALWQRKLARDAAALHASVHFDVAHHLTFASDWLPVGIARLDGVPKVWGPIGGATYLPLRLSRWVGPRSAAGELCRSLFTRALRRLWGDPMARRSAVVAAQNQEVARRFRYARRVELEANAALDDPPRPSRSAANGTGHQRAIFVGRLVGWKGPRLAVAAIAHPLARNWTLEFYGAGRDEPHVRALAARLGVGDRVIFHGHRPRSEVLAAFATADAMLFPSMHDSAGWVAGEASAAGCPVVCLDRGGPPLLAGPNAYAVSVAGDVVGALAAALVRAGQQRGGQYLRWSAGRLPELLADWYADAASTVSAGSSAGR